MKKAHLFKQFLADLGRKTGQASIMEAVSQGFDAIYESEDSSQDTSRYDGLVEQIDVLVNMATDRGMISQDQIEQLEDLKKQVAGYGSGWKWAHLIDETIKKYGRESMLKSHLLGWLEHLGLDREACAKYIEENRDDNMVRFALNKDWIMRWAVAKRIGTELGIPGFAEATNIKDLEKAVKAHMEKSPIEEAEERYDNLPIGNGYTSVEARSILNGSIPGNKQEAEKTLNRLYSEWKVRFKTLDGSLYTTTITGAGDEETAWQVALKCAVANGNGDKIDKSGPMYVKYDKKWEA